MQRRSGKGGSNPRLQIMPATPQPLAEPEIREFVTSICKKLKILYNTSYHPHFLTLWNNFRRLKKQLLLAGRPLVIFPFYIDIGNLFWEDKKKKNDALGGRGDESEKQQILA